MEKLVAIMRRKSDIILITDCRLKGGVEKIRKILRVGRGVQYDLYANSSKSERGLCIAINRGRDIEILQEERDLTDENYLLLKCRLENTFFLLGVVYGPNANNINFYANLRTRIESYGIPFLIGGILILWWMGQWAKKTLTLKIDNKFPIGRTGDLYGNGLKGGIFAIHLGKNTPCPAACRMCLLELGKGLTMSG